MRDTFLATGVRDVGETRKARPGGYQKWYTDVTLVLDGHAPVAHAVGTRLKREGPDAVNRLAQAAQAGAVRVEFTDDGHFFVVTTYGLGTSPTGGLALVPEPDPSY